jgi:predicted nucleic acid-binding protein
MATAPRSKSLVVLDNSAALGLLLPDERGAESPARLMAQAPYVQFIAPALWRYEIANGLNMALRRGRIEKDDLTWIYAEIKSLDIRVLDDEQSPEVLVRTAQSSGLTGYDAAYLELAVRLNAKLATNDKQLKAAAIAAHIEII